VIELKIRTTGLKNRKGIIKESGWVYKTIKGKMGIVRKCESVNVRTCESAFARPFAYLRICPASKTASKTADRGVKV